METVQDGLPNLSFGEGLDRLGEEEWQTHIMAVADAIADVGIVVVDGAFSPTLVANMNDEYDRYWRDQMAPAGIGRGHDFQQNTDVRRDKIIWLESETPAVSVFLQHMDRMKQLLNRTLYLGLNEYEAHFALYQPGDFYKTHLDAFRGQTGRKLSTVLYINQAWREGDGGQLGVYWDDEKHLADIEPVAGRLVIFLSESFPHEVKPAIAERKSVAGWFRVNEPL